MPKGQALSEIFTDCGLAKCMSAIAKIQETKVVFPSTMSSK
jgi:hypothetical protein